MPRTILGGYTSYNFRDKDPIVYAVRDLRERTGLSYKQVEEAGGPKAGTLRGWDYGKVRRPQSASSTAAIRAMGFETAIVKGRQIVLVIKPDRWEPRLRKKRNGHAK